MPAQVCAVIVVLSEWLRSTVVSPKSAMRAEKSPSIKILLYGLSAGIERPKNLNLRFSDPRERTASHGGTSAHEQRPPAVGVRSGWWLLQVWVNAHQFQPIGLRERSDTVHDCPMFHPFGNHHQGVRGFGCPEQRQQVWVFKLHP